MQCPGTQLLRREMSNELESDADVHAVLERNAQDYLFTCLGKYPRDGGVGVMDRLWSVSGKHIYRIYKYVLSQRQGIGKPYFHTLMDRPNGKRTNNLQDHTEYET